MAVIRRWMTASILAISYSVTLVLAAVGRVLPRRAARLQSRLAVTGTFYNHAWFVSHAVPLSRCGIRDIIFVADEPQDAPPGVRFVCPPRWMQRVLGRAVAKLLCMIRVGWRERPDLYMGFHIFPGAISALVAARLMGRPACYQMTGGPIEVDGGGYSNENRLMSMLRWPCPWLERLAMRVVAQFDLVVVRGRQARSYLADRGVRDSVTIIPGSVDPARLGTGTEKRYDLVFVGRLTEIKQPVQFVDILAGVNRAIPGATGAIIGEGPLRDDVRRRAAELGIADQLTVLGKQLDPGATLRQSKLFVMTSRSEGLSIAMMEAMACGLPCVVADVGELGDVVSDGKTGWLVPPNAIEVYVQHCVDLLKDAALYERLGRQAREAVIDYASQDAVAMRWQQALGRFCNIPEMHTGATAVVTG